jgi:hypothetical protein
MHSGSWQYVDIRSDYYTKANTGCGKETGEYKTTTTTINSNIVFTKLYKYYLKVYDEAYYFLNTTSSR